MISFDVGGGIIIIYTLLGFWLLLDDKFFDVGGIIIMFTLLGFWLLDDKF
jgi:hypothetical protein